MSKKVLFIGDVHGLTEWRELALDALKSFYEVVFLGDYLDSFHVSPVLQQDNLKSLITFLRKKPKHGKITALLGNHDYAYIHGRHAISGYQHTQAHIYRDLFEKNRDLFQIAWGYTGDDGKYTLATHAGLTYKFWTNYVLPKLKNPEDKLHNLTLGGDLEKYAIHDVLNFMVNDHETLWKVGSMRGGWGTPGPLWADYQEFLEDPYPDINQVFGHTPKPAVTIDKIGDYFAACVDSWGNKKLASLVMSL